MKTSTNNTDVAGNVSERFREKYTTQILDALSDMIIVIDYGGNVVDLVSSPATIHLEEVTAEQLRKANVKDVFPREAYENIAANMANVIATGKPSVGHHTILMRNGFHHCENTISPLDEEYLLCVFRDITQRINAFSEVKMLERVLDSTQEGILATTPNGDIRFCNERFKAQFGIEGTDDVKDLHLCKLVSEDTVMLWRNMVESVKAGNNDDKYLVPVSGGAGKGAIYEIFANLHPDASGEELVWHFIRDISLRLEQETEITRLNNLLNAILNNVPVFLFVKDVGNEFRYLYWNKAFAEFSGIPKDKAVGKNDYELFSNKEDMDRFHEEDLEVLERGYITYEREALYPNGEVKITKTIKTTFFSGETQPYIIGVSWDVTDVKNAQQELDDARIKAEEADHMKSAFLANMSHEIRTPLNAIVGFSKLAIEAKDEEEKWMYIDIVEKNTKLLLNLFNDILDLAAIESDALQFAHDPVLIHELCTEQYELSRHTTQYGVKLFLDECDQSVSVLTDWNRVSQVLVNLLNNAVKFTTKGEIHFGYQLHEDVVQFYVKDTGIGIPADKIGAIFKRFGKVNNFVQGSGLGLTLCRMLIDKMGGRIWVRSKEGEGTTFYFTIPRN